MSSAFGKTLPAKWKLTFKVLPFVGALLLLKFAAHKFQAEFLTLSPLFTAIISANIFLIGFLITGVLTDYKESEKIPGELAASLEVLLDERLSLRGGPAAAAAGYLQELCGLSRALLDWFHKREKTRGLMDRISALSGAFAVFDGVAPANYIARLKQEQHNIRRLVLRVHTIRETSFSEAGYAIAEIITAILSLGLVFVRIDPFYESVFFVVFVSFMLIYMVLLIKDLDNPFGYYEEEDLSEEVSLKPLEDTAERITAAADKENADGRH